MTSSHGSVAGLNNKVTVGMEHIVPFINFIELVIIKISVSYSESSDNPSVIISEVLKIIICIFTVSNVVMIPVYGNALKISEILFVVLCTIYKQMFHKSNISIEMVIYGYKSLPVGVVNLNIQIFFRIEHNFLYGVLFRHKSLYGNVLYVVILLLFL